MNEVFRSDLELTGGQIERVIAAARLLDLSTSRLINEAFERGLSEIEMDNESNFIETPDRALRETEEKLRGPL
ncbi:MAG: hypothetical protein HY094_00415 [Candidatus Melainabacteria bacterium]|nr:hypothetical protein [Candidatus Melainabacteria bacterium]